MTTDARPNSGRFGQVLCGILGCAGAVATVALGSAVIQGARATGDWIPLAVLIVPALFTAVFVGPAILFSYQRRQERALGERKALNPGEPWMWTDAWRDGRIPSSRTAPAAAALAGFAVFWNGLIGAAAVAVYRTGKLTEELGLIAFFLLFGVAGLAIIGGAFYAWQLARKYPPAVFEMNRVPGVLGGQLAGVLRIPSEVAPGTSTRVKLSCDRTYRSGKNSTTQTLWQDEVTVPAAATVPVMFTIPFDLPPSATPDAGTSAVWGVSWTLSLTAQTPGIDYLESFVVPVFATAASDRSIQAGKIDSTVETGRPPHAKSTILESTDERTVIAFLPARGLGWGVAIAALLPAGTWFVARYAGADTATAAAASGMAGAAGAVVLALAALGVWLTANRVEIDRDAIRVPHGQWPLRWTRTVPLADIQDVRYAAGESQRVDAITRQGGTYWISGRLSGPEEAKWLAAEVQRAVARYGQGTSSMAG